MQIGRTLTINTIIKKLKQLIPTGLVIDSQALPVNEQLGVSPQVLDGMTLSSHEQTNKSEELEIIKKNFNEEIEYDKVSFDDDNSHLMTMFNSSFCNGSILYYNYSHQIDYLSLNILIYI